MGGGAETMFNQITFIFSKESDGNVLSMQISFVNQKMKK